MLKDSSQSDLVISQYCCGLCVEYQIHLGSVRSIFCILIVLFKKSMQQLKVILLQAGDILNLVSVAPVLNRNYGLFGVPE